MASKNRITSDYNIAMEQIGKCMNYGWVYAYVYDEWLCPEVIVFLAEHGFDVTINRGDIHTTITWFDAEEGRMGKIVAPEYNFENKKELGFKPRKVIEAVDARRIAGEQQYNDAKEAIAKAEEKNVTMTMILEPVYQEVGKKLNEEGIHVQVFLKKSFCTSETRFFWGGKKGTFSILKR